MFIDYASLDDYCDGTKEPYISRPAWRICWFDRNGNEWLHNMPFPRRRDAEAALKALELVGITDDEIDRTQESSDDETIGPIEAVMLGALQW